MANKYTKTKPNMEMMISLYNDGMTQKEVAEEMGITQKIVWRCLRDAKVLCRAASPRNQKKDTNNNWKGSMAGYQAFHRRLDASKGRPKKCEICGTIDDHKKYDWANLTGKYDDPNDYKRMCRSCHWKYDKTYKNFRGSGRGRKAIYPPRSIFGNRRI
jgi:hypothetical protein